MEHSEEKLTLEEVLSWFDESENFKHLPNDIQDKIVRFFVEQPSFAISDIEIRDFLKFGRNFIVYYAYNEFIQELDYANIKAILACKANFDSFDNVTPWADSFHPKLVKSIPPSQERVEGYQNKYCAVDLFITMETVDIYEFDVYVAPMFNTFGYLVIWLFGYLVIWILSFM